MPLVSVVTGVQNPCTQTADVVQASLGTQAVLKGVKRKHVCTGATVVVGVGVVMAAHDPAVHTPLTPRDKKQDPPSCIGLGDEQAPN